MNGETRVFCEARVLNKIVVRGVMMAEGGR